MYLNTYLKLYILVNLFGQIIVIDIDSCPQRKIQLKSKKVHLNAQMIMQYIRGDVKTNLKEIWTSGYRNKVIGSYFDKRIQPDP